MAQSTPSLQTAVAVNAAKPVATPATPATPAAATKSTAKPSLQDLLEKYVSVVKITNTSSHFTHEGICKKCGWHTMQLSDEAARTLLRQHVQQHWQDVSNQLQ